MNFLQAGNSYLNPRTVEEIMYETTRGTYHYFDKEPEYYTTYTVYAVLTSGRKVALTWYDDRDCPNTKIDDVVAEMARIIEEALT